MKLSCPTLKKLKKDHPEINSYIFFKKSHPIQISYTQIVFISCILEIFFLCSSFRRFLHHLRPYWCFCSFSSTERFLYRLGAYWSFLLFSSWERFWYLSRASFRRFSLRFSNIYLPFLYIEKSFIKYFFLIFFRIFFIRIFFIRIFFH